MPTLPEVEDEKESGLERARALARQAGHAIGADHRVTTRLLIFLFAASLGSSMAPVPWAQIAIIALIGITLDVARGLRR